MLRAIALRPESRSGRRAIRLLPLVLVQVAGALASLRADPPAAPAGAPRPRIGLWYTVWWTADDRYRHWVNCHRLPVRGRYAAGDPAVISEQASTFRDLGVDFLYPQ